jgi:hypothetical protein
MTPEPPIVNANFEHRQSLRADLFQEVLCEAAGVVARSQVADVSVGGMFVDMHRTPFPAGSTFTVRFTLHAGEPRIVARAEAHYVQPQIGMGIRFLGLARDDREAIAAYVAEAALRKSLGGPPVRKSARVAVEVPVRVRAARTDGATSEEHTRIITLSKHGACLVTGLAVDVGMKLLLETARGLEFRSNVVWVGSEKSGSGGQVGVQCRGLAQSLGFQFP